MVENSINFKLLREPFPLEDVEWRVSRSGKNSNGVWAMVLAYITNRAVQDRLDDVCKPENWGNQYIETSAGWFLCGISVKINGEWVTKWDGAEQTKVEEVKGGLSGPMKRAAVQWGIGRYLYSLTENFATVCEQGQHRGSYKDDQGKNVYFKWNPPALPAWALPVNTETVAQKPKTQTKPQTKAVPDIAKAEMEINAAVDIPALQAVFGHWWRVSSDATFQAQITVAKNKRKLELQDGFIADYDKEQK